MDPLLRKAMKFKFPEDSESRTLEHKGLDELKEDLARLQELDDELNPEKKKTLQRERRCLVPVWWRGLFMP